MGYKAHQNRAHAKKRDSAPLPRRDMVKQALARQAERDAAEAGTAGWTLGDIAAGRVPAEVLDAEDEGPGAEWEARWK